MFHRFWDLGDQMSETDRVTLETLEKVNQITELLDEVATDEMRQLLEHDRFLQGAIARNPGIERVHGRVGCAGQISDPAGARG